MKQEQSAARV
uniref:Uncharacterized protein n=1 Tax=Arundo donax TaxID=35708 RepID=A0A0A9BR85_ARUDO